MSEQEQRVREAVYGFLLDFYERLPCPEHPCYINHAHQGLDSRQREREKRVQRRKEQEQ